MKAEAPNKVLSHNPARHRSTKTYDVLAQPPQVAQGLGEIQVPVKPQIQFSRTESTRKRRRPHEAGWSCQLGQHSQGTSKAWGYHYDTRNGLELWQGTLDLGLTLITDKAFPTRLGTSTCRDSTLDLTFVKNMEDSVWTNSATESDSDHYL
ncbi:hypothetical protein HPB50_013970 [Hyalomma asiaticum]|uniref:Uncharacterized protein n=1 Tax=Hyalomma asiaticum TaxID=266040 RepID=A0ACB7T7V7_HYAAI|nr:hypothetical protein HPB50_013970 [Hyalomma asiaticum]